MTHSDVTYTTTIPVAKAVPHPDPRPLLMGPNNAAISFCCKSTGFISLGAMSTKPALTPGEEVKFYYGIANNSHTKVKAVSVTIYEKKCLYANGHSEWIQTTLYTNRVDAALILGAHEGDQAAGLAQVCIHITSQC